MMNSTNREREILDLESSSLDSYSNFINRDLNNFTTSSEVSLVQLDHDQSVDIPPSPVTHNRTFIKEISTTIINAFTGKPISPNPWGKLCSKLVPQPIEPDLLPVQFCSPNSDKCTNKTLNSSLSFYRCFI